MISESAFPNTKRILEAEAEIIFQELFLRKTCLKRIKAQNPHERRKVGPENSTYKPHGHRKGRGQEGCIATETEGLTIYTSA
jgi:hypothetical protein